MNARVLSDLGFSTHRMFGMNDVVNFMKVNDAKFSLIKYNYSDYLELYDIYLLAVEFNEESYFKQIYAEYDGNNPEVYTGLECDKEVLSKLEYKTIRSEFKDNNDGYIIISININEEDLKLICPELMGKLLSTNRRKSARK